MMQFGTGYDPYISMPRDLVVTDFLDDSGRSVFPTWSAQLFSFFPFMVFFNFLALVPFFEGIASLSLPALVLPAFCMSITISFINALTKFITGKG